MIPVELLSMLGGSITGFIFRYMAEKRDNDKQLFERLISLNEQKEKHADAAAKRVPIDVGKGVRRLIVIVVLFSTLAAPFILPFFGIPTFVEVETQTPEVGIIPSVTKTFFVELNGYLYAEEYRQVLLSIVGFYFGSAAAANKS
jgi:hypothetical protein